MMDAAAEHTYRQRGLQSVEGWLDRYSADFIATIAAVQRRNRWSGALGEIGVHHGKLFILLQLNAAQGEALFAIDLFENQQLNIDRSGCGNREIFLRNIARWGGNADTITIITKSSLETAPDEILDAVGPVRLASIDGGHTEECTFNDLLLIERVVADYGVVIIDDCFNQHWPGVSTGVAKYLMRPTPALHPFAISPNKVYFARPGFVGRYRQEIRAVERRLDKESVFFGNAVDIYGCHPPNRTMMWHLKDVVKSSRLGPYALVVKTSVAGWRKQR